MDGFVTEWNWRKTKFRVRCTRCGCTTLQFRNHKRPYPPFPDFYTYLMGWWPELHEDVMHNGRV